MHSRLLLAALICVQCTLCFGGKSIGISGGSQAGSAAVSLLEVIKNNPDEPVNHLAKWLSSHPGVLPAGVMARRGLFSGVAATPEQQRAIKKVLELYSENPGNDSRMLKTGDVLRDLFQRADSHDALSMEILQGLNESADEESSYEEAFHKERSPRTQVQTQTGWKQWLYSWGSSFKRQSKENRRGTLMSAGREDCRRTRIRQRVAQGLSGVCPSP